MKAKKIEVEVGQILFVTSVGMYTESKPNLTEYEVTDVKTKTFYAKPKGSDHKPSRFETKSMTHNTHIGYIHTAFLTAESYWQMIERRNEAKQLRMDIQRAIPAMKLSMLREIKALLDKQS